jgi:hypothetical protein
MEYAHAISVKDFGAAAPLASALLPCINEGAKGVSHAARRYIKVGAEQKFPWPYREPVVSSTTQSAVFSGRHFPAQLHVASYSVAITADD